MFEQPQIKYYTKELKMDRPYKVMHKNIIDIPMLGTMIESYNSLGNAEY